MQNKVDMMLFYTPIRNPSPNINHTLNHNPIPNTNPNTQTKKQVYYHANGK